VQGITQNGTLITCVMTATLTAISCKLLALILPDKLCSQAGEAKHVMMTHWQRRLRKFHVDHGVWIADIVMLQTPRDAGKLLQKQQRQLRLGTQSAGN